MLKKQLEEDFIREQNQNEALRLKVRVLNESLREAEKEVEEIKEGKRYVFGRMENISQSIHTILQVKYPYTNGEEDICEEKRFLMFLHELCVERKYREPERDLFGL